MSQLLFFFVEEVNQILEWTYNGTDNNCDQQIGSNVKRSRPSSPIAATSHVLHGRKIEGNRQQLSQVKI